MKRPRRLAVLVAFGTGALAGWVGAGLAGLGSLGIESTGAPIDFSRATSAAAGAEHADAPRATAPGKHDVSGADIATGSAALSDPLPMPRPAAVTPDAKRNEAKEAAGSIIADTAGRRGHQRRKGAAFALALVAAGISAGFLDPEFTPT